MSITFDCSVSKVQTLADGGIRVTLDLPEQATDTAKKLMDWRGLALWASVEQMKTGRKKKGELAMLMQNESEMLENLA